MWMLILSALAGEVTLDDTILDSLLAKQLACNDLQVAFESYKLTATKRIDGCSDTLRLNKQVLSEAQSVLEKQGRILDETTYKYVLTQHELDERKRKEPLKLIAASAAGVVGGGVAVLLLASAL
jgi:hypothetical protein